MQEVRLIAIPYSRTIIGSIPWYSVLMVSGILIAYLLGTREEKRLGLPQDSMLDMVLVAVPCGIVGARLYYVLMSLDQFVANPISVFYIWEGGIAVYGSIIGGMIGVLIHCRVKKRSFAALMDISAPGLVLAQAIGRWGNYFNREAYGPVISNPAWQFFPAGVLISEGGVEVWHVATFFYESMWNLGVFITLWLLRKHVKRRGDVFLWYVVLYGSGRFLVEQLRVDSLYFFGLRASQYLSLLLCAAVAAVFVARQARGQRNIGLVGSVLACAVPLVRLMLPADAVGFAATLALLACATLCLALDRETPHLAFLWLAFDAAVCVALIIFNQSALWHSPYFLYAGLSIPPYFAIPYARLARQDAPIQHKEV